MSTIIINLFEFKILDFEIFLYHQRPIKDVELFPAYTQVEMLQKY